MILDEEVTSAYIKGFKICKRVTDGYISVSKLEKDLHRSLTIWLGTYQAQSLMQELASKFNLSPYSISFIGGTPSTSKWIHPGLFFKFASWLVEQPETKEKQVQLRLHKEVGGRREVKVKSGYIDILTSTEVIEVKRCEGWKGAIGQVLVYAKDYPGRRMRIHLFGKPKKKRKELIEQRCAELNIRVTWEK